jgi:murein L,D-transpeptidase YcbB/YkuD
MPGATDRRRRAISALAAALILLSSPEGSVADHARAAGEEAVAAAIQAHLERASSPADPLVVEGEEVASRVVLPQFYARRRFRPAWSDPADVDALLGAVRESVDHGLDPADYHEAALAALRPLEGADAGHAAALDLLLTDAVLRLAYHFQYGKVDPSTLDADWNFVRELPDADYVMALEAALSAHRIRPALDELAPRGWLYEALRRELGRMRAAAASGGWPRVPDGASLRPGASDPRVAALRARLAAGDELEPEADPSSPVYDEALAEAVRRFQRRHGLADDGVVGARTLAALNVGPEARIDQLRVNLERARWVLHDLPARFVLVNVASFEAFYFADRELPWRARAQVGRDARRTPIFRADMKYLVLNPTWTVPQGIVEKDILSAGADAASVVERKGLRVLDRAGREVAPASVAWGRYTARNLPYTLRQDPGPSNALGRVKFMFPNPHLVYLHDTPSKELFERSERAFSSGCIRIERPLELAELLLDDPVNWSRERIDAVVASGETTTVWLDRPLPVLLLYWTALPTLQGPVRFFRDLYGRDPEVLAGLARPPEFRRAVRDAAPRRP